ncbi:hypothetical protein, partial [Pseudonocardia sp. 73-21]
PGDQLSIHPEFSMTVDSIELGPYRVTRREVGVSAGLVWLTHGEVSPITWATSAERPTRGSYPPNRSDASPTEWWCAGVSLDEARAESWVALSMAAGQAPPSVDDWRSLRVEPRPAQVEDNTEFAYGVWRTLSWLLGVREDFPIYTSWQRAAGIPPERPHLDAPLRGGQPDEAWHAAERASQEQARAEALHWWRHVRAQVDAAAAREVKAGHEQNS